MHRRSLLLIPAFALGLCAAVVHERSPEERLRSAVKDLQEHLDEAAVAMDAEAKAALRMASGPDSARLWRKEDDLGKDDIRIRRGQ